MDEYSTQTPAATLAAMLSISEDAAKHILLNIPKNLNSSERIARACELHFSGGSFKTTKKSPSPTKSKPTAKTSPKPAATPQKGVSSFFGGGSGGSASSPFKASKKLTSFSSTVESPAALVLPPPPPSTASSTTNPITSTAPFDPTCPSFNASTYASSLSPPTLAPFSLLSTSLHLLTTTPSRLLKHHILTNTLLTLLHISPVSAIHFIIICTSLTEKFKNLNVGGSLISSAIKQTFTPKPNQISNLYKVHGDLGSVCGELFSSGTKHKQTKLSFGQKVEDLCLTSFWENLKTMNELTGSGVNNKKKDIINNMMSKCSDKYSIIFLVRILISNIRVGCTIVSFLDAISEACYLHENNVKTHSKDYKKDEIKCVKNLLRSKYDLTKNDVSVVLNAIILKNISNLHEIKISTFSAVASMLGHPVNSIEAILQHYGEENRVTCEFKYDGVRCQIHYEEGGVRIFNRHSEENTETWLGDIIPYLKSKLEASEKIKSFILDVEVVAVDRSDVENVKILPFQTLSTRKRKVEDIETTTTTTGSNNEVDVCVFAFDCLYVNEEVLVDLELSKRREKLSTVLEVVGDQGYFEKVTSVDVDISNGNDDDDIDKLAPDETIKNVFDDAVKNKCEGLMTKSLKSKYEAGARGGWLKLKKDYIEGLCDTLDVVPIGAWRGTGRKAEKGFFSPWLMAVYDKENNKFESICRLLSLTDEMYKSKTEFYQNRLLESLSDRVKSRETNCYFWEPCEVWEIKGADLTASPVHTATLGLAGDDFGEEEGRERGVGLRFPRFVRERSDKSIEDATSSEQILKMFKAQHE